MLNGEAPRRRRKKSNGVNVEIYVCVYSTRKRMNENSRFFFVSFFLPFLPLLLLFFFYYDQSECVYWSMFVVLDVSAAAVVPFVHPSIRRRNDIQTMRRCWHTAIFDQEGKEREKEEKKIQFPMY